MTMLRRHSIPVTLGATLAGLTLAWAAAEEPVRPPRLAPAAASRSVVLKPARVFDGVASEAHAGWVVVVQGQSIVTAGPEGDARVPEGARVVALPDATLLPGLIDAHTHILLHPYDEAS